MKFMPSKLHLSMLISCLIGAGAMGFLLCSSLASAAEPRVLWECSGFSGEAQDRCIRTYAELQQEKISKLEKAVEAQEDIIQQLQQKAALQAAATANLEYKLTRNRRSWGYGPSVRIFPPLGFALSFGRERFWGGSFFSGKRHYYGQRFYGRGYQRWRRF